MARPLDTPDRDPTSGPNAAPPHVYAAGKGFVYALNKHQGHLVWERELKPGFWKTGKAFVTLVEGQDALFACAFGIVFCLRKHDGSVVWQHEIKKLKHDVASLAVDATLLAAQPNHQGSDAAVGVDGDADSDGGSDGGGD